MSEPREWTIARSIVWASAMLLVIGSFVASIWILAFRVLPVWNGVSLMVFWMVALFFTALTRYRIPPRQEGE